LPEGTSYDPTTKWLEVFVGGAPVPDSLIQKDSPTQFTLLVDPSDIPDGVKVIARWVETYVPATSGHASKHYENGVDPIDVTKLMNYKSAIDDRIGILLKRSVTVNLTEYDSLKVAITGGYDWTNAFQQAVNDLSALGGGTIYVPAGTYYIDADGPGNQYAGVALKSNITVILDQQAVVKAITNASDSYAIFNIINQSNVRIVGNGTIQGDRSTHTGSTGQWGMGIYISQSSNVLIKDVTIKDCWGDAIYVGGGSGVGTESENIRIQNVIMDNNRRQGISVTHAVDVWIENNTIMNTNGTAPKAGIDIEPNANQYVKRVKIFNNIFRNNDTGVQLFGTAGLEISDITISGNTCDTNVLDGIYMSYAKDVKCTNNSCSNNSRYGILVENCSDILIQGNTANNNASYGIYLRNSSFEIEVLGNKVRQNGGNGIFLNGCSFCAVKDNKVLENGSHGIYVYNSNDNDILDNRCVGNGTQADNTYDNININADSTNPNGDNNNIQGNTCRKGAGTNKSRYGIAINSSYCDNNLVTNNDLYDSGVSGDLLDNGTGTRTKPTATEFRAYQTTPQSLNAATSTIIKFDTVVYDTKSEYNPTTGAFTAKSSGIFVVTASLMWNSSQVDGNVTQLSIYKNGTFHSRLSFDAAGAAGTSMSQGTAVVKLNKGDYIDVRAYTSNSLSTAADQFGSYFEVFQLT
jgi:parallel beta-helix repeat protein